MGRGDEYKNNLKHPLRDMSRLYKSSLCFGVTDALFGNTQSKKGMVVACLITIAWI